MVTRKIEMQNYAESKNFDLARCTNELQSELTESIDLSKRRSKREKNSQEDKTALISRLLPCFSLYPIVALVLFIDCI